MAGAAQTIGWLLTIDDSDFVTKIEAIKTHVQDIKDDVEDADTTILGGIADRLGSLGTVAQTAVNTGIDVAAGGIGFIEDRLSSLGTVAQTAVNTGIDVAAGGIGFIEDRLSSLGTVAQTAVNTGIDAAAGGIGFVTGVIGGAISGITGMVVKGAKIAWSAITGGLSLIKDLVWMILGPVYRMLEGALFGAVRAIMEPILMVFKMAIAPFVYFMMPVIQRWAVQLLLWVLKAVKGGIDWIRDNWDDIAEYAKIFKDTLVGMWTDVSEGSKKFYDKSEKFFTNENMFSSGFNDALKSMGVDSNAFWKSILGWIDDVWELFTGDGENGWGSIREIADQTWKAIKQYAADFWELIKKGWNSVVKKFTEWYDGGFAAIWDDLKWLSGGIWDSIKSAAGKAIKFLSDGFNNFLGLFNVDTDALWAAIWAPMDAAFTETKGFINRNVIDLVNKMTGYNLPIIGSMRKAVGIGKIPRLAEGGVVTQPTLAWVGEGGNPEAVVPLPGGSNMSNSAAEEWGRYLSAMMQTLARPSKAGGADSAAPPFDISVFEKMFGALNEMRDALMQIVENTEDDSWATDPDFNGQLNRDNFER